MLEAALGVLDYDAVIELQPAGGGQTAFAATREVRLAPGAAPDMLVDVVAAEAEHLRAHFAA